MQVLATCRRLEYFLKELANTRSDPKAGMRLKRQFPEFLPHRLDRTLESFGTEEWAPWLTPLQDMLGSRRSTFIDALVRGVRSAWAEPDGWFRQWRLFLLRLQLADALGIEDIMEPPPLSPLDQAMRHLEREGRRAKRCANGDCPAPYFWAKKKNQKFCSDECAAPAKRESKLRWWHDPKHRAKEKRRKRRSQRRKQQEN